MLMCASSVVICVSSESSGLICTLIYLFVFLMIHGILRFFSNSKFYKADSSKVDGTVYPKRHNLFTILTSILRLVAVSVSLVWYSSYSVLIHFFNYAV